MTKNNEIPTSLLALSCLDLTSLSESDTFASITELCEKGIQGAKQAGTPIAAVCVYPQFVQTAKQCLAKSNISVATVINFPTGDETQEQIEQELSVALSADVDELDVVLNWNAYLNGDLEAAFMGIDTVVKRANGKRVKIIMETGALGEESKIKEVAIALLKRYKSGQIHFLKTSTGKLASGVGATYPAVKAILEALKEEKRESDCGCKVSGGVKTIVDVEAYFNIVESILTRSWISKQSFRFGASKLFDELLNNGNNSTNAISDGY